MTCETRDFGAALDAIMRERGLNQMSLITMTGLSSGLISGLVQGKKRPTPATVRRILDALDLNLEQRRDLTRAAAISYLPADYREALP